MCPPRATSGLVDDRHGPISTSVIEPDVAQHVSTDGAPGSYPGRSAFRPRRRRSAPEIDTGSLPTRRCVGERDLSMTPVKEPRARLITTLNHSGDRTCGEPAVRGSPHREVGDSVRSNRLGLAYRDSFQGRFVSPGQSARPTLGQSGRRIAGSSQRTHPAVRQSVVLPNPDLKHNKDENSSDLFPFYATAWAASQVRRRRIAGKC